MRKSIRYFLSVMIVFVFGCGGGGGTVPTIATAQPGDVRTDGIKVEMVSAVNSSRSAQRTCGSTVMPAVNPIVWNDKLAAAAFRHSVDMATHASFSHAGTDGSTVNVRISQAGYNWSAYGENIAAGQPSAASVVSGWMNSEGHCKNIMSGSFTEIGAAYDIGSFEGNSSARYWTLDLAKP